jgi:ATP-binding cassette subfamily B protein
MQTLWRVLQWVRPYFWREALAYGTVLGINAILIYMPLLVRRIVDEGIPDRDFGLIARLSLALIGLTLVRGVVFFMQGYLTEWISQNVAFDFRNQIYRKLQDLSFSYHDRSQTGQLLSRATSDVERLRFFTGRGLLRLVDALVLFVSTSIVIVTLNSRLAALALAMTPIIMVVATRYSTQVRPLYRKAQDKIGELATRLQDNLTGLPVVKSFAQERAEIKRFESKNDQVLETRLEATRRRAVFRPIMTLVVDVGSVLILWYGGRLVIDGSLSLGELVAFNAYLLQLVSPMRRVGWLVTSMARTQAAAERVFEILDAESEVEEKPDAAQLEEIKGHVTFEEVTFRYLSSTEPVLQDISFEAKPGEIIALMGATGSGKSTIINLIPRFYDVSEGRILIDGIDIRDITLDSLRSGIGIVLQETQLFGATIRENLAFGAPDVTLDEIKEAAKAASAHDFILSFPDGYETVVGERGVTLSGGQRQRIAIARALLIDPRILILDDSTSSVDAETERLIQQALARLMEGRTSFVIAQRFSSVRNADMILLLDKGRIVARGKHEELLHESGLYAEIYYSQLAPEGQAASPKSVPKRAKKRLQTEPDLADSGSRRRTL